MCIGRKLEDAWAGGRWGTAGSMRGAGCPRRFAVTGRCVCVCWPCGFAVTGRCGRDRLTESFCPEEGWVKRAPLPAGRVGHCLVALGGKLYRQTPSRPVPRPRSPCPLAPRTHSATHPGGSAGPGGSVGHPREAARDSGAARPPAAGAPRGSPPSTLEPA